MNRIEATNSVKMWIKLIICKILYINLNNQNLSEKLNKFLY